MNNIYQHALNAWGEEAQLKMAIEECAELIVAINKSWRKKGTDAELAEEIADVEIMCNQLRLIVGPKLVERIKKIKLKRLENRLWINTT